MWFHIDSQSGVPIYRQIAAQVEQAVLAGVLRPGDKLPAVRELALDLAVNPNTVVKAYDELQRARVIEQPRGRGTFVRGAPTLDDTERRDRFRSIAQNFVAEARRLGYGAPDILAQLHNLLDEPEEAPDRAGH